MCKLRHSAGGKVKIYFKYSSRLGDVTSASGSVCEGGMTSSCLPCNPVSKERYLSSCAGWNLQSLDQVLDQDDGGSELQRTFRVQTLQSWHNLTYSKLWISPVLPIDPPAVGRCEQQGTHKGVCWNRNATKTHFLVPVLQAAQRGKRLIQRSWTHFRRNSECLNSSCKNWNSDSSDEGRILLLGLNIVFKHHIWHTFNNRF